jgi:hypothetical protein
MKKFIFLLIPLLSFANPFGSEEEQLREVDQLVKRFNVHKAKVESNLKIAKEERIDTADVEFEEEKAVETLPQSSIGFSYKSKSDTISSPKCENAKKPDLDETLSIIGDHITKEVKYLEEFAYLIRWFYLADQISSDEEGSFFYLLNDSDFDEKLDAVFEKSMDEDFIPNSDLTDALEGEKEEWTKYLNSVVCDFGDIDKKFYKKSNFKVKAPNGLNLRENPLTGVKLPSKYVLRKNKMVYLNYFTFGTAKDFDGTYRSRWAKITVPTSKGNKIGWVNMRYLRAK